MTERTMTAQPVSAATLMDRLSRRARPAAVGGSLPRAWLGSETVVLQDKAVGGDQPSVSKTSSGAVQEYGGVGARGAASGLGFVSDGKGRLGKCESPLDGTV